MADVEDRMHRRQRTTNFFIVEDLYLQEYSQSLLYGINLLEKEKRDYINNIKKLNTKI